MSLDAIRTLCGPLTRDALALAAELLSGIESAVAILAPVADEDSPAGITAGVAHALLADLVASAKPPPGLTPPTSETPNL